MIIVRCRDCNKEVVEGKSCGCPNMVTVKGDIVTAIDLNRTIMIRSNSENKKSNALSPEELAWQEQRRKRKVRKLDFEIR